MGLNIEETREKALKELEGKIKPVITFLNTLKEAVVNDTDVLGLQLLVDWSFTIPLMYGELRRLEAEYSLSIGLIGEDISRVKAEVQANAAVGSKVTENRAEAALITHDLQVLQQVNSYLSKVILGYCTELEMHLFSLRALIEIKKGIMSGS